MLIIHCCHNECLHFQCDPITKFYCVPFLYAVTYIKKEIWNLIIFWINAFYFALIIHSTFICSHIYMSLFALKKYCNPWNSIIIKFQIFLHEYLNAFLVKVNCKTTVDKNELLNKIHYILLWMLIRIPSITKQYKLLLNTARCCRFILQ